MQIQHVLLQKTYHEQRQQQQQQQQQQIVTVLMKVIWQYRKIPHKSLGLI